MNCFKHSKPAASTRPGIFMASALAALMLSGCGDDREGPTTAQHDLSQQAAANGNAPQQTIERFRDEVKEPDRDLSIDDNASAAAEMAQFGMVELAIADIEPTEGNTVAGTVRFSPADDRRAMLVEVDVSGLKPGKHGFHIHANGDCSSPDAASAGGHFNPYHTNHGSPSATEHHLGDLGNVQASKEGRVDEEIRAEDLAFSGPASVLQKAVVIHAKADDLETDPSGKSGNRIGCGVIRQETAVLAN